MESHKLFNELKTSKKKIIWMLENYPKTRDDDNLLYLGYLMHEIGGGDIQRARTHLQNITAYDFLRDFSQHEFVNFATLIRCRRLIQANETYKHLRGTKYQERAEADNLFRNNIHNL